MQTHVWIRTDDKFNVAESEDWFYFVYMKNLVIDNGDTMHIHIHTFSALSLDSVQLYTLLQAQTLTHSCFLCDLMC